MNNDSSSRIVAGLLDWIANAPSGAKLPSTRSLVAEYGASPVTVQKALRTLNARGLVESRPGSGTFVRAVRTARPLDFGWQTGALRSPLARLPRASMTMRDTVHGAIALHAGYPDRELLPERLVRAALTRAARSDVAVSRSPVAGLPELQAWFAQELAAATPIGITPPAASDVVVLPGSQSGLSATFRALVGAGQPLLVESPTYWGAILAATQAGVRVVPVVSGQHGPDPEDLARAFDETGARAFYAQPNYSNPSGAQWSTSRASEILAVVRSNGAFLIEDDWAHDFGIGNDPVPVATQDDAGHVVYIRSLTKSVSPAIRIAGVIARGPVRERILAERAATSMYVSGVLQAAALDVVTQPGWKTHLRSLRDQLRARRDLLVDSMAEFAAQAHLDWIPQGGLNLWFRLPDGVDLPEVLRACEDERVLIAAGDEWFPAEPAGTFVRLNYSGPNPGAFPEGARVIGSVLEGLS
ncbi:aminotransferase-like domain-containing protein [Leucobacter aridicollis]|uniref:aminotransferase-like domain-containing protein n=1 Tax=Leucobacter aridicollis TaxID=283878 RepID=UPI000E65AABB|nr:PLP-dependent aminotransferase family protein [Leucobacter aridicollis]UTX53932.1 PLP-dependent aminotransferase family protein [Leucobacter aridicollis]